MKIKVIDIFFGKDKKEKCALSIVNAATASGEDFKWYLSNVELEKFNSISSEKRKIQYCLGRAATKKALCSLQKNLKLCDIGIINEESGCPAIKNSVYAVSIAHTDRIVASLVFRKEFSFGIDVEYLKENRISALKSITLNGENIPGDLKSLTAAWTLKESLSKALKCGFTMPFEEFKLCGFSQNSKSTFSCSYEKYPEYAGFVRIDHNNNFYAVAYRF